VDVVSQVARKFAAGEAPLEPARPKTTSATPMFSEAAEDCSFWCIVIRCIAQERDRIDPQA
jgi:hypothetical protein